ncbi:MAG TPA: V-type ATP synthase subunit I [Candidatus Dorea intestinavium]|nr:V-type ATP synthase subunit I [Candidatus Dorea intestinavium]
MAKLQMQRVSICAMKKNRKAILERLQNLGVMEINTFDDDELEKMDTFEARQRFEKQVALVENALEILAQYAPAKTSLFDGLKGKEDISKENYETLISNREEILNSAKEITLTHKEIEEIKASQVKIENQIEGLTPWLSLDVPMNYEGTNKTALMIGTMSNEITLEEIYSAIYEQFEEEPAVDVTIINKDKDASYVSVIALKEEAEKVEEALRLAGFSRPSNRVDEVPSKYKENLEAQILSRESTIKEKKEQIVALSKKREELKLIADYYRIRKDKYEVLGKLPQSERTFFVSGYVAAEKIPVIQDKIGSRYNCAIDVEEIKEDEDVPVILENGTFASSVEGVVESYGLPGKNDIDPSKITAFFYVVFFGLMLSDAAYGLIVFLACFIVIKKFPKMSAAMKQSIRLFMYCGISTMVWGILFGGYFGDVIPIASKLFFGHEVTVKPAWFAPLDDPMRLLIYSLAFGLIHLYVGLGIKGYMAIRDKDMVGFIFDVVCWFVMVTGLVLMLIPSQIFVSMSQMDVVFPDWLSATAKGMAIVGALGILLMAGRRSKNFGLRLALGAYDLYNITGWLSDVLSYSRLLALGLATGVVASVVNQMGSMAGNGVLGIIIFVFAFIVGHIFNMAINLLGAYVHTCRLQYVEFFGKFYEGDGRPFNPFKENTNYIDVKEE